MSATVMFIAGEDSGDQHAARVIEQLKQLLPGIQLFGYGGNRMQAAGMQLVANLAQELPIIGFTPVIRNLSRIRQLLKEAARLLEQRRPDVLVLVDYPGFNLRTAKVARRLGIPVIYYISPQVWVWHKSRLKTIAETVSKMLVILPFEEPFYRNAGLSSAYVGHPLQDDEAPVTASSRVRANLGAKPDEMLIGLIPGSRESEINRHLPMLLEAGCIIHQQIPNARFIVPKAATIQKELLLEHINRVKGLPLSIAENDLKSVRAAMDFAICKSGTSTLELALAGVPMVIFYKASILNYLLGRLVVKIPWIGLPNIIAGRDVVPELIQGMASAQQIAITSLGILQDSARISKMREELAAIRASIGGPGAAHRVADEIAAVIRTK